MKIILRLPFLLPVVIFAVVSIPPATAAPVRLPRGIMNDRENLLFTPEVKRRWDLSCVTDTLMSFGFESMDRDLRRDSAGFKADIYSASLRVSYKGAFDVYFLVGAMTDAESSAIIAGSDVRFGLEDQVVYGGGLSLLNWEIPRTPLTIFSDFSLRRATNIDYDSVTVDGTSYRSEQLTGRAAADWREWQAALGLAAKTRWLKPYGGVMFSDVDTSARVTIGSTSYDAGDNESDETLGFFAGAVFGPVNGSSLDLQARFAAENSFSVSFLVKF